MYTASFFLKQNDERLDKCNIKSMDNCSVIIWFKKCYNFTEASRIRSITNHLSLLPSSMIPVFICCPDKPYYMPAWSLYLHKYPWHSLPFSLHVLCPYIVFYHWFACQPSLPFIILALLLSLAYPVVSL